MRNNSFEINMCYEKGKFDIPKIQIVTYNNSFFQAQLNLESDLFYEFRKKYNILPHKINESSYEELSEIKKFFNDFKRTFYFYFEGEELVASVLFKKNYIQALTVSRNHQRKGYGTLLTKYGINELIDMGYKNVDLLVFKDNINAINMYKKIGFKVVK